MQSPRMVTIIGGILIEVLGIMLILPIIISLLLDCSMVTKTYSSLLLQLVDCSERDFGRSSIMNASIIQMHINLIQVDILIYIKGPIKYQNKYFYFGNQPMSQQLDQLYDPSNPSSQNSKKKKHHINKSYQGLQHLKQTEDYIDKMKRRLSLLQIQQQKNKKKADENYRKVKFLSKVRQQAERDHERKVMYLEQVREDLQRAKYLHITQKIKNRENIKSARNEIIQFHKKNYESTKWQMNINEKQIIQEKKEDIEKKQQRKAKIQEMEEKQRKRVQLYHQKKNTGFKNNFEKEGDDFQNRKSSREKLLSELSKLQGEMIRRQSTSRVALNKSSEALSHVRGRSRSPKSRESEGQEKFPKLGKHEMKSTQNL